MSNWQSKMKEIIPNVKEYISCREFTSMGVGGVSDFYVEANTIDELVEAVSAARKIGAPYRVIGNGTNIICSDKGFNGLLIKNKTSTFQIDEKTGRVIADSGVSLSRLILESASKGLGGLEPLYGIPGTVGGAIVVNAGAHGVSISRHLQSSSVMISSEKILNAKNEWFEFKYRQSKLKYKKEDSAPVILNAIFQLQRRKKEDVLSDIARYKGIRQEKQPLGEKTCGSIFKNPAETDAATDDQIARTAGYLLDQSGVKKFAVGGAHVYRHHANWVINSGNANANDVRKLVEKMRRAVEEKFQITLIEEIEYLGDWDEIS